ncbi:MAG: TVP38/TMEM64 family protein [Aquaticitalea sp.]
MTTSKSRMPLYLSIGLIGGLVACYFSIAQVQQFFDTAWDVLTSDNEQRIQQWVNGFGWLGPIVLIFAMVAQMFLLVIPTLLLMVVSVLAYGPLWGSIISFAAVFAASTVGYGIGRYFGERSISKLLGKKTMDTIESFIEDYGFWAVVVTRLNPFLSNDAISFVGGMLKMGYWRFIGATLTGITPLIVFIAIVGDNIESMKTGLLYGSLVCLLVFLAYLFWDKIRK